MHNSSMCTEVEMFSYEKHNYLKSFHVGEIVGIDSSCVELWNECTDPDSMRRRKKYRNGLNLQKGFRTAVVIYTGPHFITVEYMPVHGEDVHNYFWRESFDVEQIEAVQHLRGGVLCLSA